MISLDFGRADLSRVRFAVSPLFEVIGSFRALESPEGRSINAPWIAGHEHLVDDEDLTLLRALQPSNTNTPDFVNPPPRGPAVSIEEQLAEMKRTPPDQVRAEIRRAYRDGSVPDVLDELVTDPQSGLLHLAQVIQRYWDAMIAPYWEGVRVVLEGDVLYRARQMASGGIQHLFADIHPSAHFSEERLTITKRVEQDGRACEISCGLDGRGLLLVPSVFHWPKVGVLTEPPWQPTLIYPARGIGTLWNPGNVSRGEALGDLIGARRADILADLDDPRSTTELAQRLRLSAPSVSQHLAVLRRAGLVQCSRVGRVVLYRRTPRGDGLVRAPLAA